MTVQSKFYRVIDFDGPVFFFDTMKHSAALLLLLLLCPAAGIAQAYDGDSEYYEDPAAEHIAYLPDEVSGTSSLFFLDGRLWTCNDHGPLVLYSLDTLTGLVDTSVDLGVRVYDLEEVALDSEYIYFGDIGDNSGSRSDLRILRLAKADLRRGTFRFDTIRFSYPDRSKTLARNFDCEAFVAAGDSLYLFTKQWLARRSVCYALPKQPGTHIAERRFTLHTDGLVTGACFLPSRRTLALIGYSLTVKPFVYLIDLFDDARFDQGRHRRVNLANILGNQMEGIATLDGIHFFITRETLALRFITRQSSLFRLDLSGMPTESNVR